MPGDLASRRVGRVSGRSPECAQRDTYRNAYQKAHQAARRTGRVGLRVAIARTQPPNEVEFAISSSASPDDCIDRSCA
jgi:hypothetical protein